MKKLESLSAFKAEKLNDLQCGKVFGGQQAAGTKTDGYSRPIDKSISSTGTVTYTSDIADGNGAYTASFGGHDINPIVSPSSFSNLVSRPSLVTAGRG